MGEEEGGGGEGEEREERRGRREKEGEEREKEGELLWRGGLKLLTHLGVELDVLVLLLSDDDGMLHRKEDIPSH